VVAVLEFEAVGLSESEVQEYTDYFSHLLEQSGKFKVIDREQRERILLEKEFVKEDRKDEKYQRNVGRASGAELIVTGLIAREGDRYTLEAKLIDTDSGRTKNAASRKYADAQELFDDCQQLVHVLLKDRIPPRDRSISGLGVGAFSGTGILLGDLDIDNSFHLPIGTYVEIIYPRWTIFLYDFWGFIGRVLFVEGSLGYRIDLSQRMRLSPFGGISMFFVDLRMNEDTPTGRIAVATGIDFKLLFYESFDRRNVKTPWTFNIRAHYSLPFYNTDNLVNPFAGALLYLIVGVGFTV
jgi:TolB-like protein